MARLARHVVREQLHHVFLGIRGHRGGRSCAVGGYVQWSIVVEEFEHV